MKRFMQSTIVLFTMLVTVALTTAHAADKGQSPSKTDRMILSWVDPLIDPATSVLSGDKTANSDVIIFKGNNRETLMIVEVPRDDHGRNRKAALDAFSAITGRTPLMHVVEIPGTTYCTVRPPLDCYCSGATRDCTEIIVTGSVAAGAMPSVEVSAPVAEPPGVEDTVPAVETKVFRIVDPSIEKSKSKTSGDGTAKSDVVVFQRSDGTFLMSIEVPRDDHGRNRKAALDAFSALSRTPMLIPSGGPEGTVYCTRIPPLDCMCVGIPRDCYTVIVEEP